MTIGGIFSGTHLISLFVENLEFSALLVELVKAIIFIRMGDLTLLLLHLKMAFLQPYYIGGCRDVKMEIKLYFPKVTQAKIR